jgi:hypothetical protein
MKIIQTFWTGPAVPNGNLLNIKGGWMAAEYHWMSWALSCLQLKKLYGEVELITDELGKKILVDTLGLPYTNVSTVLEGKLSNYPPELWSLAKIVAFAEQQAPFLHFDGDFFIWQPVEPRIMQAAVVAQNLEENLSYYRDMMQDMEKHGWRMPPLLAGVSQSPIIYAANTGIFGGHQLDFVKAYCQNAFDFINTNTDIIPKTKKNQLNFIFEQCLLYYFAQQEGIPIEYFMEEPVDEPSYSEYARFVDVPQVKMIHTLGGFKNMPYTCSSMAKRLRNDFPAMYYHILAQCGDVGVSNKVYQQAPFNAPDFYPKMYQQGMEQYLAGGLQPAQQPSNQQLAAAMGGAFETAFGRSLQFARYLTQPIADTNGNGEQPADMAKDFAGLQQQINAIANDDQRALAATIFDIETRAFLLANQLSNPVFVEQQYFKELIQHSKVAQLFTQPVTAILAAKVCVDDGIQVLEVNREWGFGAADVTKDLVEEVLNEEDADTLLVLKVDIEKLSITELYPDTMDRVVMDICQNSLSIADIVEAMKEYFDAEEIENDYAVYQKLIVDTVKQLLYGGLLQLP